MDNIPKIHIVKITPQDNGSKCVTNIGDKLNDNSMTMVFLQGFADGYVKKNYQVLYDVFKMIKVPGAEEGGYPQVFQVNIDQIAYVVDLIARESIPNLNNENLLKKSITDNNILISEDVSDEIQIKEYVRYLYGYLTGIHSATINAERAGAEGGRPKTVARRKKHSRKHSRKVKK